MIIIIHSKMNQSKFKLIIKINLYQVKFTIGIQSSNSQEWIVHIKRLFLIIY